MRSEVVEQLLESLASPGVAPAGRVCALHAALGAALVAKVARGRGGSGDSDGVGGVGGVGGVDGVDGVDGVGGVGDVGTRGALARAADGLRETALRLAVEDVAGASPEESARAAVRVLEVADRALGLLETLRPTGHTVARPVLNDVAKAAEALRAAVGTARVDVEVDLAALTDPTIREELLLAIDPVDDVVLRAAKVTAVVREQIPR